MCTKGHKLYARLTQFGPTGRRPQTPNRRHNRGSRGPKTHHRIRRPRSLPLRNHPHRRRTRFLRVSVSGEVVGRLGRADSSGAIGGCGCCDVLVGSIIEVGGCVCLDRGGRQMSIDEMDGWHPYMPLLAIYSHSESKSRYSSWFIL